MKRGVLAFFILLLFFSISLIIGIINGKRETSNKFEGVVIQVYYKGAKRIPHVIINEKDISLGSYFVTDKDPVNVGDSLVKMKDSAFLSHYKFINDKSNHYLYGNYRIRSGFFRITP